MMEQPGTSGDPLLRVAGFFVKRYIYQHPFIRKNKFSSKISHPVTVSNYISISSSKSERFCCGTLGINCTMYKCYISTSKNNHWKKNQ